jgi:hypothetical protein
MLLDGVHDVFSRGSLERFFIRVCDGGHRTVRVAQIASHAGRIIWAFMVVAEGCLIETIDDVGSLEILLPEMVSTVRSLGIITDDV